MDKNRDEKRYYWVQRWTYRLRFLLYLFYDVSANSPVALHEKPIIIAPNHKSFADHWIIALAFSEHIFLKQIPFRFLGHPPEHFPKMWRWVVRLIWWAYGVVNITFGEQNTIAKLRQILKEDRHTVIMYPEGTRVKNSTQLRRFRLGIARLHRETGAKILPVAIQFSGRKTLKIWRFRIPYSRRKCVVNFDRTPTALPEYDSMQEEADWLQLKVENLYIEAGEDL